MALIKRSDLHTGLAWILRPVVRFCLRNSLKMQEAYAVLRAEFVAEAQKELALRGETETLSKLSVMTGIPRKYINGIRLEKHEPEMAGNIISNIVDAWQTHKRYGRGYRKRPQELSCEGNESEFAELVRSVSADLNPYTVMNELERVKLIEKKAGKARLNSSLYLEGNLLEALEIASADSEALLKTIEHNVAVAQKPHLHLFTTFDNIPDENLEEIREWFLMEGSKFQLKAREYLSKFDRDRSSKPLSAEGRNTVRVVLFESSGKTEG